METVLQKAEKDVIFKESQQFLIIVTANAASCYLNCQLNRAMEKLS